MEKQYKVRQLKVACFCIITLAMSKDDWEKGFSQIKTTEPESKLFGSYGLFEMPLRNNGVAILTFLFSIAGNSS